MKSVMTEKNKSDTIIAQLEEYFEVCRKEDKMPTKGGLSIFLDIDRKGLWRLKQKGGALGKAIETTYLKIEDMWVQRLKGSNVAGTIFYLKNAFAWRDAYANDITTGGKPIPILEGMKGKTKESTDDTKEEK